MTKFIIRNDDVGVDASLSKLKKFSLICDKYNFKIIQSITPFGTSGKYARSHLTNQEIKSLSPRRFEENKEMIEFLKSRNDLIAVHGLWHTHAPTIDEVTVGKKYLEDLGFKPTYFVPPFNEGDYPDEVAGLILSKLSMEKGERLEDFLEKGTPTSPIAYLHFWRFGRNYTFEQLDKCLERLSDPIRHWYNNWVKENASGAVLDIGKSRYWDYGFPTLDSNPKLNPTYIGDIQKVDLPNESFDTVLCNGMYEFIENPQAMIDEVLRITKKGGTAIFGFVGKDYPAYKRNWKYYDFKEKLPIHDRVEFGRRYYYLICQK